jgi:hypothetical protein
MKTQNSFAYLEAKGKSKIWEAYAKNCSGEEIMEEGFNVNSGYVYLALENGIQIASAFGQEVEFFAYDRYTDEEIYFDSYEKLIEHLQRDYQEETEN